MTQWTNYLLPAERGRLTVIAWYQILGGLWGLSSVLALVWQDASTPTLLAAAIGGLLNSGSIYAGFRLQRSTHIQTTIWMQAIQILNFKGLGLTYFIVSGLALRVGFEWIEQPEWGMTYEIHSAFKFGYNPNATEAIRVMFNMVPAFIIYYVLRLQERGEERQLLANYSSTKV